DDVAREQEAPHERVLAPVEGAPDRLVVGVEAPGDAAAVEARLQLRDHAAVAHALDALSLVALGDAGPYERARDLVQAPLQHRVHVVHELARYAVLVRGHAELERAHCPLD